MSDGYNKYTRNPNYVGEMMIYSALALLVQMWEPWYFLALMWSVVFSSRMMMKDYSLSKKAGWKEYSETSWILPPKWFGSTFLSVIIYSIMFAIIGFCL